MHIGGIILLRNVSVNGVSSADTDFKYCEIRGSHGSDWRLLSSGM
jgi:hypothetical protein